MPTHIKCLMDRLKNKKDINMLNLELCRQLQEKNRKFCSHQSILLRQKSLPLPAHGIVSDSMKTKINLIWPHYSVRLLCLLAL